MMSRCGLDIVVYRVLPTQGKDHIMYRVMLVAAIAMGIGAAVAESTSAGHFRRHQRCCLPCNCECHSCAAPCQPSYAPEQPMAKPASPTEVPKGPEGAWRLVAFKSGSSKEFFKMPEGSQHIKILAGGRFVWTSTKNGTIVRSGMGAYTVLGDKYTEHYEQVLDDKDKWFVGTDQQFNWKIEGDKWHHIGVLKSGSGKIEISEIWERLK